MDYRYNFNIDTKQYNITETRTGLVVRKNINHEDAKTLTRHMNLGGGFAGWTPEFVVIPIKMPENTTTTV